MTTTYYISYKTGKKYVLTKTDEETNRAVITDESGDHHLVKLTTLKKTYKKVTEEVKEKTHKTEKTVKDEPTKESKNNGLTKHQKEAIRNIHYGYTWTIGGLENDVQDGNIEALPSVEDMFEQVYAEVMDATFDEMSCKAGAPICMKFAGKAFVRKQIAVEFARDGYEVPEDLIKVPERKPGHSNFVDGERVNLRKDEGDNLVTVRAFTGMLIGTFKVKKQTKSTITIKTVKGDLKFDRATGIQIDANNPKFANRIDING